VDTGVYGLLLTASKMLRLPLLRVTQTVSITELNVVRMKTYQTAVGSSTYQYFYDRSIRLWTIYRIDSEGFQLQDEETDHVHDKVQLLERYPDLDFVEEPEQEIPFTDPEYLKRISSNARLSLIK
jgi:hypothetical protein